MAGACSQQWVNAQGRRLLCSTVLKKNKLKCPELQPAQVRACWPELANHTTGILELCVPDGSGASVLLRAHVTYSVRARGNEGRKTYHLSNTGRRFRQRSRCGAACTAGIALCWPRRP